MLATAVTPTRSDVDGRVTTTMRVPAPTPTPTPTLDSASGLGRTALPAFPGPPPLVNPLVVDEPEGRIAQAEAFWHRNPGYQKVLGLGDVLRDAVDGVPGGARLREATEATAAGYGQPILDQMRWQARTGRQPGNEWWMRMNARLVGDALTAESYLRAGRPAELVSTQHQAWLSYLHLSDGLAARMAQVRTAGDARPSLPVRMMMRLHDVRAARQAYWTAHHESVRAAAGESEALLARIAREAPQEAAFSRAWARTIRMFRTTNPPAAGGFGVGLNRMLLPQHHPVDRAPLTTLQGAFVDAMVAASRLAPRG